MIQIEVPEVSTDSVFALIGGYLCGPMSLKGEHKPPVSVSFRSSADSIETEPAMFGENRVTHTQAEGNFTFSPLAYDRFYEPYPNSTYPLQHKWGYRGTTGSSRYTLYADYGYMRAIPTLAQYQRYMVDMGPDKYSYIQLGGTRSSSRQQWESVSVSVYTYTNPRAAASGRIQFDVEVDNRSAKGYDVLAHIPFDVQTSRQAVIAAWESLPRTSLTTKTEAVSGGYPRELIKSSLSIATARREIDALCWKLLFSKFEYELEHYGVLAERASKQVNANQVNMIAFVLDLKNPRAMIPKLKRLSKLKDIADGYLSVNYGLLPTIDDLKSIFEAFQRSRPYLDKNGFKTYNAVYTTSASNKLADLDVTQRIKLAIANTDEGISSLASSIDNIGFLPTFENLWDLIPYSFVIDWFVNIGDILEKVDSGLRLARLPIKYVTTSLKLTTTLKELPETFTKGLHGSLSMVQYSRGTSDKCPVPPIPSLGADISAHQHVLEGSALIIQRGSK